MLYLAAAPATASPPSPPGQHSPRPPWAPRRVGGSGHAPTQVLSFPGRGRHRLPERAGPSPREAQPPAPPSPRARGPQPHRPGAACIAATRAAPGARAVGSRFPPEERQGRLPRVAL